MFPSPAKSIRFFGDDVCKHPQRFSITELESDLLFESDPDSHIVAQHDMSGKVLDGELQSLLERTQFVRNKDDTPVGFNSLRGKYLTICCIPFPLPTSSSVADGCRALIDSYDDLTQALHFEMILVVKMRKGYEDNKDAFHQFFSVFPCLAIPFTNQHARHSICSSIGLNEAIVIDPNGYVLQHWFTFHKFHKYGSDWAPFYEPNCYLRLSPCSTVDSIEKADEEFRARLDPMYAYSTSQSETWYSTIGNNPLSLHDILHCHPMDRLDRYHPHSGFHSTSSTVQELAQKYVGLYLCVDGMLMEQLQAVHEYFLINNQELEIVLVCMSLFDDPNSYDQALYEALSRYNIKSWFLFKSNSKVLRRIWRIYGQGYIWDEDRFIIIPPNGEPGELEGRAVITKLGIHEYPFTRSTILQRRLEALRSLTPEKLFNRGTGNNHTSLVWNGRKFMSNLQGKKLILYLDWLKPTVYDYPFYNIILRQYYKIKAMGWEVVFVPLDVGDVLPVFLETLDMMPWPYMPHPVAVENRVVDQLTFPEEKSSCTNFLIAVGEDGRILSRQVRLERLETYGFEDGLEKEIACDLCHIALLREDFR